MLTAGHKTKRILWARKNVALSAPDWKKVIHTYETKFNLDGLNGFKYYWHEIHTKEKLVFTTRSDGGGIMVWGGFSTCGKPDWMFYRAFKIHLLT